MRYLIVLTFLVSTTLQAAVILKWVDADGNVNYGDAPPVTVKSEPIRVQAAPSNPGKSLPRLSNSAGEDGETTTAGEQPPVPKDQAKIACDQAKEDLQVISRSTRIKLKSSDGSERYLTTEEIEQRQKQAQTDVDRFCN